MVVLDEMAETEAVWFPAQSRSDHGSDLAPEVMVLQVVTRSC